MQQSGEVGRIHLSQRLHVDVKALASSFLGSKYLKAQFEEYILNEEGRTILLFEGEASQGFSSVYSPLNFAEFQSAIQALHLEQRLIIEEAVTNTPNTTEKVTAPLTISTRPIRQSVTTVLTTKKSDKPEDLPSNHFLHLEDADYERMKQAQMQEVALLDENDNRKILYYRRFTNEFQTSAPLHPKLRETLQQKEKPFEHYALDESKLQDLPTVASYTTTLEIPSGVKLGIVIGYHHLEKPWGNILKECFLKQVQFPKDQVEFINVQNAVIPTGDPSSTSEREVKEAVEQQGITHIVDVHEQLSGGNHYMDFEEDALFKGAFRTEHPRSGKPEYTLDPFVPLWCIEQYYKGNMYPQLQFAVNEQIKKIEKLIQSLGGK